MSIVTTNVNKANVIGANVIRANVIGANVIRANAIRAKVQAHKRGLSLDNKIGKLNQSQML